MMDLIIEEEKYPSRLRFLEDVVNQKKICS